MFGGPLSLLWNSIARSTLCELGQHTRPRGVGFDACTRGCGFCWRPDAAKPYVVTFRDGSVHRVDAINPYHAESLVVYGSGPLSMNPDGTPRGEVKVHRANVVSVVLSTEFVGSPLEHGRRRLVAG